MTKYERAKIVNTLNALNNILLEKDPTITEIVYTLSSDGNSVRWIMPICDSYGIYDGKKADVNLMHDLEVYTNKLVNYELNNYLSNEE